MTSYKNRYFRYILGINQAFLIRCCSSLGSMCVKKFIVNFPEQVFCCNNKLLTTLFDLIPGFISV